MRALSTCGPWEAHTSARGGEYPALVLLMVICAVCTPCSRPGLDDDTVTSTGVFVPAGNTIVAGDTTTPVTA